VGCYWVIFKHLSMRFMNFCHFIKLEEDLALRFSTCSIDFVFEKLELFLFWKTDFSSIM